MGERFCDVKRWCDVLFGVVILVTCPTFVINVETYSLNGMSVRQFEDLPNVVEVECSGRTLGPQVTLFSLTLYAIEEDLVLASVTLYQREECGTSSSFSACFIDDADPFNTRLKTLVVDLDEGEERRFGCNVSMTTAGRPAIVHWAITAVLAKTDVAYGTPWAGSTTVNPGYTTFTDTDLAIAAEVQESPLADVQIPSSAVIAGLVLLILLICLTIVMIIVRHKGTGRRDSWYDSSPPSTPPDDLYAKPNSPADRDRKSGEGGGALVGEGGALLGDTPFQSPAHLLPPPSPSPRYPGFLVRYQSPLGE